MGSDGRSDAQRDSISLELDSFQTAIVTSNTQLRDKIHILRTLVSLLPFEKEKIERFDETLAEISNVSFKRNMMAHNGFSPSSDGNGVSFSVTKAKGTLFFPPTIWDIARFKTEYAEIDHLKAGVSELAEAINHKQITEKMGEAARALPVYLQATSGLRTWFLRLKSSQSPLGALREPPRGRLH